MEVTGTAVPFEPENYVIVYKLVNSQIVVTYPHSGESLIPGEHVVIRQDTYAAGNVTVQYTLNNGEDLLPLRKCPG